MRIPLCYPDPPPFHRDLLHLGLDRVLLHLVTLQLLVKCLHYQNNAPRREFIDP